MPGCLVQRSLARTCSVAGYIDHVAPWRIQCSLCAGFCRPFSSRPALPLGLLGFFSTDAFVSVRGACSFPLVWGLGCAVVPVMGVLFQSRGWLPVVEAPGYFRHPTSILAMQLLMIYYSNKNISVYTIPSNVKRESLREFYRGHFCIGNPRLH